MALLNVIPKKDSQFIMNNIGVYLMENDLKKAEYYFKKVLDISPMDEAYENLANVYAIEGKTDSAEEMWAKAMQTENLKIKDETMHSMFKHHMKKENYAYAAKTAERLIALKDSLSERQTGNNVKAIQSEFDNIKSKQKYERNIMIAIIIITVLVLIATVSILFLRYKQYKTKAAMAHDQMMIKNYESQIKELERMDLHKEKEIEAIKTTVLWKKNDFENIIEYYRLVDMEFVDMLDNSYDELSPKYKFFLILEHIGMTDKQIMASMGIAEVSVRSIRSRVNKRKKDS